MGKRWFVSTARGTGRPKGERTRQEQGVAEASPRQTPAGRLGLAPEGALAAALEGGKGCTQAIPSQIPGASFPPSASACCSEDKPKKNVHEGKIKKGREMAGEVKLTVPMAKFSELYSFLGGITHDTTASIHKQNNKQAVVLYSFTYCNATSAMMFSGGKKAWWDF